MGAIFEKTDRVRLVYDWVYRLVMVLCKLLLIVDIGITCMSVVGRYVPFIPVIVLLASFFIMMIMIRFPIAYAVALSSVLCLLYQGLPLTTICQQMVKGIALWRCRFLSLWDALWEQGAFLKSL